VISERCANVHPMRVVVCRGRERSNWSLIEEALTILPVHHLAAGRGSEERIVWRGSGRGAEPLIVRSMPGGVGSDTDARHSAHDQVLTCIQPELARRSLGRVVGHIGATSLLIFGVFLWQLLTVNMAIYLRKRGIRAGQKGGSWSLPR